MWYLLSEDLLSRLGVRPVVIRHEVDGTFVGGVEGAGKEFTYTPHKALACVWQCHADALQVICDTIELQENRQPHIVVSAALTAEELEEAFADLSEEE